VEKVYHLPPAMVINFKLTATQSNSISADSYYYDKSVLALKSIQSNKVDGHFATIALPYPFQSVQNINNVLYAQVIILRLSVLKDLL
jgi:hypothetical protein